MLNVRELAALARQLDEPVFAQQMGPFALVQRPPPESRVEASRFSRDDRTSLRPMVQLRKAAPVAMDFGDLLVATLPPPDAAGEMVLVIGRMPDCDLVVEDPAISKHHASVSWADGVGVLRELGSSNGTYINGHRMRDSWTLRDGDALRFGESHFIFMLIDTLYRRMRTADRF
jgi:hypothetical protein